MKTTKKPFIAVIIAVLILITQFYCKGPEMVETNRVILNTSMGEIEIVLFPEKAPVSVENFKQYTRDGFYTNLLFHRVMKDFMIQSGSLGADMTEPETRAPIQNEASNGLKNFRGTIAYARKPDPNSATSGFYVNLVDNPGLDYPLNNGGYAVFGRVVRGMDVVDQIAAIDVVARGGFEVSWPVEPVILKSIDIIMEKMAD